MVAGSDSTLWSKPSRKAGNEWIGTEDGKGRSVEEEEVVAAMVVEEGGTKGEAGG